MKQFAIEIKEGHLLINVENKRILIDTGSPATFGNVDSVNILNKNFPINRQMMGMDIAQFSSYIGFDIDILLGGDILSEFNYKIDLRENVISFYDDDMPVNGGFELPISYFSKIPIIEYRIGARNIKAFFDTGAKVSYINSEIAREFKEVGQADDFYPGVGQFKVTLHEIPINIGGNENILQFGVLPGALAVTLMMANTESILGNAILKHYIISVFSKENKMHFEKR